ncbi:MAG: hypothetical protein R3A45_11680 [Bdellovibrionota bacterium]
MKDEMISAVIRFSLVLAFVFLFHLCAFTVLRKGYLLNIVDNFHTSGHEIETQLWRNLKKESKLDCLVLGEASFVENFKKYNAQCDVVFIPHMQLKNVSEALGPLHGDIMYKTIFVENKVRFWTNMLVNRFYYINQANYLLNATLAQKKSFFSFWPEKNIFRSMKDIVNVKPVEKVTIGNEHLSFLWFRSNPPKSKTVFKKIKSMKNTDFYWVIPTDLGLTSSTNLENDFLNYFTKQPSVVPGKVIFDDEVQFLINEEGKIVL